MRSVLTEVRELHYIHYSIERQLNGMQLTALLHVMSVRLWHSLVRVVRGNDPEELIFISEFRLWFWIYIDLYILTSQLRNSVYY